MSNPINQAIGTKRRIVIAGICSAIFGGLVGAFAVIAFPHRTTMPVLVNHKEVNLELLHRDVVAEVHEVWGANDYVFQNITGVYVMVSNWDTRWATTSIIIGPELDPAVNWVVIHKSRGHWRIVKDCGAGTARTDLITECRDQALPKSVNNHGWTNLQFYK